jgi:hypothetical protein
LLVDAEVSNVLGSGLLERGYSPSVRELS